MKTAMITGASRGIGLAIAKQLFADGYQLSVLGIADPQKFMQIMDENGIDPNFVLYVQGNVAEASCRQEFVKQTVTRFGGIDLLVNNAGVAPKTRADLLDMTEESFDHVIGINLKGNLGLTQLVAKQMISQPLKGKRKGVIINISSCSAYASSTNRGEYCVSKAGIAMLTKLFAHRLAEEKINVFEVRPGIIATDMTAAVTEKYETLIHQNKILPIERFGEPQDVANVVSVLCDEKLCYCTGDVINVDGGFHIPRL